MTKKIAASAFLLAACLTVLTACGSVSSVSPQAPGQGGTTHKLCNIPQQPGCF